MVSNFSIPLSLNFNPYSAIVSMPYLTIEIPSNKNMNHTIVPSSFGSSALQVALLSNAAIYFSTFKIMYLAYSTSLTNIEFLHLTYTATGGAGDNLNSGNSLSFSYTVTSFNTTGTIQCFSILSGFNIKVSSATGPFDFDISGQQSGSNSSIINFILSSRSASSLTVKSMSFALIVWNQNKIESGALPTRVYTMNASNSSSSSQTSSYSPVSSYNTFWGFSALQINSNKLDWTSYRNYSKIKATITGASYSRLDAIVFTFPSCSS
jgi:hypothetical protein